MPTNSCKSLLTDVTETVLLYVVVKIFYKFKNSLDDYPSYYRARSATTYPPAIASHRKPAPN